MTNHPTRGTRAVNLTAKERQTLILALQIAAEDGSIYPTEMGGPEQKQSDKDMNALIDIIIAKLRGTA